MYRLNVLKNEVDYNHIILLKLHHFYHGIQYICITLQFCPQCTLTQMLYKYRLNVLKK